MEIRKGHDPEKIKRILKWKESISTLPDNRFYEIIRIYLGEIKTPFNKNNLLERLSAVLYNEQNQKNIVSFISEFDIKIINAIYFIPDADIEKIISFFKNEYTISVIYSGLSNLSQRLIIYSSKINCDEKNKNIFHLNPLLEDILKPFINIKEILTEDICIEKKSQNNFSLSPLFIASFISYIQANPEMCKMNITFKKRDEEKLNNIFSQDKKYLELLLTAFINMDLVRIDGKKIIVNEEHLYSFAKLSEVKQYAYICTASVSRWGRDGLQANAQLLLNCAQSLYEKGVTKNSIIKTALLIKNKSVNKKNLIPNRFSRIIQSYRFADKQTDLSAEFIEKIIDSAIDFGLFTLCGKTQNGEEIFIKGNIFNKEDETEQALKTKEYIKISTADTITVFPGMDLISLLPITDFANIAKCSVAAEFEINKKSVCRAFDKNIKPQKLFSKLSEQSGLEIPQSLKINIEEWYNSYSSICIYKGYLLKTNEKNARFIENNPKTAALIKEKLAEGVFFLNIPDEKEPLSLLSEAGISLMSNVKTAKQQMETVDFPFIHKGKNIFLENENDIFSFCSGITEIAGTQERLYSADKTKKQFYEILDKMDISSPKRECLAMRIEQGIIISKEQLCTANVRLEVLEASGTDFAGKVNLLGNIVNTDDAAEIIIYNEKNNELITHTGKILMLSKHASDTLVKIQTEPNKQIKILPISKAKSVKIIRNTGIL